MFTDAPLAYLVTPPPTPVHRALFEALDNGEIGPWFQTLVCAQTGTILGAEALARWVRPNGEIVSPGEFLPGIESAGLMDQLPAVMVRRSTADTNVWMRDGLVEPEFRVSVNVSGEGSGRLVDLACHSLDAAGLSPHNLCLEITENDAMGHAGPVLETLAALGELGVHIAMGDFGTGHSSLARFGALPLDAVNIDRAFVSGLPDDRGCDAIVAAVVDMADVHGLTVVVEGVETMEQADAVAALGVSIGQGFFYGRPMPARDFRARLYSQLRTVVSDER
ncbi:MAG: EAL domain-containing protein (putative c-di-GMP-specific phosphodiesterase class I) [Candidatus Poriferisodalaceae bacterium]|jgi:EAL domain-containing protein (putative c-di-GMP-specific phosphodiesterase class I)